MHDACRIFPDGSGSYDQVINSIGIWQDVRILHVPANVVFEPVWKPEHEPVFEEELIKIKDFLLRDRNYTR